MEPTVQWTKVTSSSSLRAQPWVVNLQSMNWDEFQHGALLFLSSSSAYLLPAMEYANLGNTITWFGSISNDAKYGSPRGFRIQGELDYLAFGAAVHATAPSQVLVKLMMKDPRNDDPELKYEWRLTKLNREGVPIKPTELLTQSMKSQDSSVGLNHDADDLPSSGEGSNGRQPLDGPIPKHQRYNPRTPSLSEDSDLEVVALPQRLFLPDLVAGLVSPNGQLNSKAPRTPMAPPQKEMDEVNMDQ
ncbi:hypothetical protein PGT21_000790 [Puccinia graminis f. sp. tritici]|uniref:Uncharacterized protein n=1 Tax=Puccinia graminis f. sp. tritici TaxID=56615 RepID=A0A5B0P2D6_PUCGR|nr:hypothetical protein PGT21_000790 [Puccinia graminis f. sp. tritici]KAA1135079.1 hypothetical protein PGTUg99_002616 [Puccinia graminis f. sp. tritici]